MPQTFYIGVKGVIIKNSKVLLLKKRNELGKLFWDIPGGRVNEGENIEEALKRELREELNITYFHILELLSVYKLPRILKDGNGLFFLFYKINADIVELKLSAEHFEYQWIGIKDIEKLSNDEVKLEEITKNILCLALK